MATDTTLKAELRTGTGKGVARKLPAWRYEGHIIWGLTHHMICRFLEVVQA